MSTLIKHEAIIPEECAGSHLDQALAKLFPQYSRSRLQNWLENKKISVNGQLHWRAKDKVSGNEHIVVETELTEETQHKPEDIDLNIIYEDDDIIIINKPAGLVVHPGAGNSKSTMLNALLHHAPQLKNIPRAGIIHRIDKDTSGLLVIAKTLVAHTSLTKELQDHKISREYEAIIQGEIISGGTIDAPIDRHPKHRIKMAVVTSGKPAKTHYRIIKRLHGFTHIRVNLETGRTHQIRVHMAHILHPLLGDPAYGGRPKLPKNATEKVISAIQGFKRQALHAKKLVLTHPTKNTIMEWVAPLPTDMQELLNTLTY